MLIIAGFSYYFFSYKVAPKIDFDELTFKTLDGKDYSKANLEGKYIFLNVIATWCGPCRAELPSIEKTYHLLKNDNYAFLVVSDEPIPLLNKFKEKYPYSYTYLQMQQSRKSLGINTIPTTYVISPKGEILYKKIGSSDWNSIENIKMLKEFAENKN